MKPEPLPGARCTVSESRRCGATQGHAFPGRYCAPSLARLTHPHRAAMTSNRAIRRAEAIMVSERAVVYAGHAHRSPDALEAPLVKVFSLPVRGPFSFVVRALRCHYSWLTPSGVYLGKKAGDHARRASLVCIERRNSTASRLPRSLSTANSRRIEG